MKKEFSISAIKAGRAFGNEAWGKAKRWVYLEGAQYPLFVLFGGDMQEGTYRSDGRLHSYNDSQYDLYLLPEERVIYSNVYPNMGHDTLEQAKFNASEHCIGHIRITITGTDFKTEDIKLEK